MNQELQGKSVFVGLSGGVDSAVTAALLQEQGAHVTGVFIKGWYPPGLPCTWAEERRDAMRVAAHLEIPFVTLDASKEYKESVIDYLVSEYRAGRTPNPDIMCNRDVKFGAFYEYMQKEKGDFLATGHYAQIQQSESGVHMLRGEDASKDQSYFLWAVGKEALAHTLFPLGALQKEEVRTQALRARLPVARKKDSQGICFLGPVSMDDFLLAEFGITPGKAVDESGKEVGKHDGVLLHTLGERVALHEAERGPWYVIAKDVRTNELTVSLSRAPIQTSKDIKLTQTNWLQDVEKTEQVVAQYRYHGPCINGYVNQAISTFVSLEELPEPVAEGQSLVLYRDNECLGGGIIAA